MLFIDNCLTKKVTDDIITIPEGFLIINIQNTGLGDAFFKGNLEGSEFVSIPVGGSYSIPNPNNRALPATSFDATGTTLEIAAYR